MTFDANEAEKIGHKRAMKYLLPERLPPEVRERSDPVLWEIMSRIGPVVASYPTWHPLVASHDPRCPQTLPCQQCGYLGLDHTVCFVNGFITCPYGPVDDVIASAEAITHDDAYITAEALDVTLYAQEATAVLVECHWHDPLFTGRRVPRRLAVALMAEAELASRMGAELAERWDVMRPYLLGKPHGKRSSLFVDEATGKSMKRVYSELVKSGMFGPMKMG